MSYGKGGYVLNGGGYDGGASKDDVADAVGLLVPGAAFAWKNRPLSGYAPSKDNWKFYLGLLVAVVFLLVAVPMLHQKLAGEGMSVQTLGRGYVWGGPPGAAGTSTIKRSDALGDTGSREKAADTFLGRSFGPEFNEQPNYVLGQQNHERVALNKYSKMKAAWKPIRDDKGNVINPLPSWSTVWKQYRNENSDDLEASLYDFGDGFEGVGGRVELPEANKLQRAVRV
jgi:hypothetical protein